MLHTLRDYEAELEAARKLEADAAFTRQLGRALQGLPPELELARFVEPLAGAGYIVSNPALVDRNPLARSGVQPFTRISVDSGWMVLTPIGNEARPVGMADRKTAEDVASLIGTDPVTSTKLYQLPAPYVYGSDGVPYESWTFLVIVPDKIAPVYGYAELSDPRITLLR